MLPVKWSGISLHDRRIKGLSSLKSVVSPDGLSGWLNYAIHKQLVITCMYDKQLIIKDMRLTYNIHMMLYLKRTPFYYK